MTLLHWLTDPIAESRIALARSTILPLIAKICNSLRYSQRYSLPRSLLRELSLDHRMRIIYQNRHRKQLYGVQWSELTVPRQMAVTWLTSLRKCRENEVRPRTPARPRDRKGVIFACVAKNGNLISESRKPPFPSNRFQWASKWLAVTYPQSKSQAITDCHNGQPRRLAKNENRRDSFLIFCLIERHIKILWQKWKACPWKRIIVSNFHCTQCSVKRYRILLPWEKGLWNAFPLHRFAQPSLSGSRIKMVHTWGPGPPSYV